MIGTATTAEGAAAIESAVAKHALRGCGQVLDVTDRVQVESVIKTIEERFGAVGILVNNAGITRDMLLMRMKDEEWDAVLATNLTAVFHLSRRSI